MTENTRFPAIFLSHGAPLLAIETGPVHDFLRDLGRTLGHPKAILVVSAHWEERAPRVSTAQQPDTIYDFRGFPEALYRLSYPAPGAPGLAQRAATLLSGADIDIQFDPDRGLDHGAWVPLMLMYPQADIPVTQLSVQTHLGTEHHFRLGEALRPLRDEAVLILGSGSATHNLSAIAFGSPARQAPAWVTEFQDWVAQAVERGNSAELLDYRLAAPHAQRNHPTEEHFLPLFVALGAGERGRRIHRSHTYGLLAMDVYRFD